jgi:hypothetical protein
MVTEDSRRGNQEAGMPGKDGASLHFAVTRRRTPSPRRRALPLLPPGDGGERLGGYGVRTDPRIHPGRFRREVINRETREPGLTLKDQQEQTEQTERSGKGSLLSVVSVASCWVPVAARVTAFAPIPESILGGARLILATAAHSKSISPLLGGLESRGQLIIAGAGGNDPTEVNPVPLLFGMCSMAGSMTGSPIDVEDTLSCPCKESVR